MKIFFLSGLGADKTVFRFLDLKEHEPIFIDWLPALENESLRNYALRLKSSFIPDNSVVVGLSFGGMLATEIAKAFPSTKAILISSSKTKHELPSYYRISRFFPAHMLFPAAMHRWFMLKIKWMFGLRSEPAKKVYEELIRNSNTRFNRWAIKAIINWDNNDIPKNIYHIHGTHDRILPYKYVKCDYTVKKGGHLMVLEEAATISGLLYSLITSDGAKQSALSSSTNPSAHQFPG